MCRAWGAPKLENMNREHPSLTLRVGDLERQRAEELLKQAYCDGRLDEVEFDGRLGRVMLAQTRRDLNVALYGIPAAPLAVPGFASRPAPVGTGVGALAHFSALFTWILGPLLVYALGQPGSPARREAAKAFNFQLLAGLACIVTMTIAGLILPDALVGLVAVLGWVGWFVLTIVGGARALSGQPWVNPVQRALRWEALDPRGR